MTIKEKREAIRSYCENHWKGSDCHGCKLWEYFETVHRQEACYENDETVSEHYAIIFGGENKTPDHDGCKGCKHDPKKSHDLPCSHCRYTLLTSDPLYKVCPDLYEPVSPEVPDNPYWERINALAEKQRAKGISKYGVGLESNPAAILERINHLQEELIDGLMYCEWIKDHLKELEG